MPTKKKEIIFSPLAEKQLLAAKHNSLHKRGNSTATTRKYFTQVMQDIRNLATGKNVGAWSRHSDFFTRAKVGRHNALLCETTTRIYIVGFIHPDQDAAAKLVDQEQLLQRLGQQDYTARLERQRKLMGTGPTKGRKWP